MVGTGELISGPFHLFTKQVMGDRTGLMSEWDKNGEDGPRRIFDSWEEYVEVGLAQEVQDRISAQGASGAAFCGFPHRMSWGQVVENTTDYAKHGWPDGIKQSESVIDHISETLYKEIERPSFVAQWDVSGSAVDMGAFVAGVPECMMEYEQTQISSVGKVVSLCVSGNYNAGVSAESAMACGQAVVALVKTLQDANHEVEIWLDYTWAGEYVYGDGDENKSKLRSCKIPVKTAHDSLDMDKIVFALSHPAVLRCMMFGMQVDGKFKESRGNFGYPKDPVENLEPGTIYLPAFSSLAFYPDRSRDPVAFVKSHLVKIGLIQEDSQTV